MFGESHILHQWHNHDHDRGLGREDVVVTDGTTGETEDLLLTLLTKEKATLVLIFSGAARRRTNVD